MHYHFITGRLAEQAVRYSVEKIAAKHGFQFSIQVLPITVAALMTAKWVKRHIVLPPETEVVVVPGYLNEYAAELQDSLHKEILVGPKDIRDLGTLFGEQRDLETYGASNIEIIAEINHADRMTLHDLIATAFQLKEDGADRIDLGCTPGNIWLGVGEAVKELVAAGVSVSIDSFERKEVIAARETGADLWLSVNSSNRDLAAELKMPCVVIPDQPTESGQFHETIDFLAQRQIEIRLDPILEPIGCGFAASLERYASCRRKFPDAAMMMGIGNITELTDVDSAGVNVILLGICQELRIQSVLTTQVINWAKSSVRECDFARQLVHFACENSIPPKHLDANLVMLRDEKVRSFGGDAIESLAKQVKDRNVRIFAEDNQIHAVSRETHVFDRDPFRVMDLLLQSPIGDSINASHAFYLGFEMAKALTANTLGKQYTQDEALNWGFLTREENHHRLARTHRARDSQDINLAEDSARKKHGDGKG
ncbi:MAG: DUF6513 domain-containing protein [Aureliella sp.]